MQEITKEEYEEAGGSPAAAVSADERKFYREGDKLAVLAKDGNRMRGMIVDESRYYDTKRVSKSKYFSSATKEPDVHNWINDNIKDE